MGNLALQVEDEEMLTQSQKINLKLLTNELHSDTLLDLFARSFNTTAACDVSGVSAFSL
jgi:hypothetical protein